MTAAKVNAPPGAGPGPAASRTDPSFDGRQRLVLLVLLGAGFMLSVDFSILKVAVPAVGAGVGLGSWGLSWITAAYALPAAGFALLFGRPADLFGRRASGSLSASTCS